MDSGRLTADQEQCLRDQVITDDQPGPVLHDFRLVLDFLGTEGVEAAGKYNLLPMKIIGELDGRLSRPLRLESKLKRPQIRSHPYLQALNLLLRASALSRVEGAGDKARLVLIPEMMLQWDRLNPTEQYFNLLEAAFRYGSPEMIGEWKSPFGEMLTDCLLAWRNLSMQPRRGATKKPQEFFLYGIGRDLYKLALMDLFGLVRVQHPQHPVVPWAPANVENAAFGDAVFNLLSPLALPEMVEVPDEDREGEDDVEEDEDEPPFGAWQPLFQPYFPEWQNNLDLPEIEPREGTFIFRVSLGKDIWRRIAMPSGKTLESLASWILRSVNFDREHLYEFVLRNPMGATVRILHRAMEEGPWVDHIKVGELSLEPGQAMEFRYDFGDNWRFHVKLERIEPPDANIEAPKILERHGKSPEQYGDYGW